MRWVRLILFYVPNSIFIAESYGLGRQEAGGGLLRWYGTNDWWRTSTLCSVRWQMFDDKFQNVTVGAVCFTVDTTYSTYRMIHCPTSTSRRYCESHVTRLKLVISDNWMLYVLCIPFDSLSRLSSIKHSLHNGIHNFYSSKCQLFDLETCGCAMCTYKSFVIDWLMDGWMEFTCSSAIRY